MTPSDLPCAPAGIPDLNTVAEHFVQPTRIGGSARWIKGKNDLRAAADGYPDCRGVSHLIGLSHIS